MKNQNLRILALDTETTTWNKGHLYDKRNFLVCTSFATNTSSGCVRGVDGIQKLVDEADIIAGFHWKFDLGWLKKNGIIFSNCSFYDCQLAEFILSKQTWAYPDLDTAVYSRLGEHKIDVVKNEYWDKGINTDAIPWPILSEYAEKDAVLTLQLYEAQQALLSAKQRQLVRLQSSDLEILQEMEWNGLMFDEEKCDTKAKELDNEIAAITETLRRVYGDVPINFNSGDHLSAFLYGGVVKEEVRTIIGHYKSGAKTGQPRFSVSVREHVLPQLCQPLRGTELKKAGFYKTDEDTLKKLKGAKKYRDAILDLSKLEKLNGTYYRGLTKKRNEMGWEQGVLHGQLNQCVTRTGRISASQPNQQNFASELQDIFVSRYND